MSGALSSGGLTDQVRYEKKDVLPHRRSGRTLSGSIQSVSIDPTDTVRRLLCLCRHAVKSEEDGLSAFSIE